ncbi:MAG: FadR/GntR family transcriptional regulator [Pseudomonadota bacterium]
MPFEPIEAPNLAAAAAAQIRDLIARDVLRPGDPLPGERELAQRMGISRTSLRAGLQTLMAEGLVVSKHGSGLSVSRDLGKGMLDPLVALLDSAPDTVAHYIAFRRMLESESAAIVAERATGDERAHINAIHDAMVAANKAGDGEAEMRLDTEFHMSLVEATGNVVSIQIARALHDLMQRTIRQNHAIVYGEAEGRAALLAQHEAINTAVQSGDADAARRSMRTHLDYFAALIAKSSEDQARREVIEKREIWAEEIGR